MFKTKKNAIFSLKLNFFPRFRSLCNIINIGDVVWARESEEDSLWWPAKVIWADNNLDPIDDRIKSTDLHVELYNRDQEKLRTSSSNLIKPFTEFVSSS